MFIRYFVKIKNPFQLPPINFLLPIVYQHIINENAKLAVWKITEDISFFAEKTAIITNISHPQKRLQFMAGRYLLNLLAPSLDIHLLTLNNSGKPIDPLGNIHFSISHSLDFVAVYINTKMPVGIDIQYPEQKLEKLFPKFLSENDRIILSEMPMSELNQICFGWSIKESLFKWYGEGQVDFKNNLHILNYKPLANNHHFACCFSKDKELLIDVIGILLDDYVLTFTVT